MAPSTNAPSIGSTASGTEMKSTPHSAADFAPFAWKALPFSLTQTGAFDRNKHTASAAGALDLYVAAAAANEFYKVSFRMPGANTGTP